MRSLFFAIFFIFSVTAANAACITLYSGISWEYVDRKKIIIYKRNNPYAVVELDYGTFLRRSSDIKILDDYPCSYSSDVFLIDGDTVGVRKISKL